MKLIIDIPDEDYKFIKDLQFYHSGRRSGRTIERNVINGIKNGTPYEERPIDDLSEYSDKLWQKAYERGKAEGRPQGEWIITSEEQGALGISYKIRKCDKCGWEHSLVIPDNFCSNCGADMRGGKDHA